jgi:hypothetical protein
VAEDALTLRLRRGPRPELLAAGAALLALAAAFLLRPAREPWDLALYLDCSRLLAGGGDPYAAELLVQGVSFPCLYPPLAIGLYRPFAALADPLPWWNALKLAGMAGLLLLWRRRFLPPGSDLWRLAFALAAFGAPLLAEFRSGNASSLEQLALWGALSLFVAGRWAAFAVAVAAAAQLKLQPAAFLGLLLLLPRPRWKELLLGAAAFAAFFALNELLHPGLLESYLARVGAPHAAWRFERGPNNCSSWGFLQHMLEIGLGNRPAASAAATRVWLAWCAVVAGLTIAAARRAAAADASEEERRRRVVLLGAAAFALAAPRFKDYAFVLLIPPALAALEAPAPRLWRGPLLAFALLNSTKAAAERMGLGAWAPVAGYFKLYAAVLVWGVLAARAGLPERARR